MNYFLNTFLLLGERAAIKSRRLILLIAKYLYCKIRPDNNLYDEKVSLIDGASVTIILCLHVLIAQHIFINIADPGFPGIPGFPPLPPYPPPHY
jgi:hypothetical protein